MIDIPTISVETAARQSHFRSGNISSDTPSLPSISLLSLPRQRPQRRSWDYPINPNPTTSYGDTIIQKFPHSIRIFFQNVHGLTHSAGLEDYKYYLQSTKSYHDIDIAGMAETNIGWHHPHLQSEFRQILRRCHQQSKTEFGSPSHAEDQSPYQPGGIIQLSLGPITTATFGKSINNPTGLGRWKGTTFRGSGQLTMSVITAHRTCGGNIRTSPLGSTFSREFNYFRRQGHKSPNPRRLFFHRLEETIVSLQSSGNSIVLMLDANL